MTTVQDPSKCVVEGRIPIGLRGLCSLLEHQQRRNDRGCPPVHRSGSRSCLRESLLKTLAQVSLNLLSSTLFTPVL